MHFDLTRLAPRDGYKLLASTIVPRPIAWVVSMDEAGALNAAPFSFFNLVSDDPPLICVGVMGRAGSRKDTAANIHHRREFVVNLVPERLATAMNLTSGDYSPEVDELRSAGLTAVPSTRIAVPRILESPVALECIAEDLLDKGGGRLIAIARVVAAYIDDDAMRDPERCHVDTPRLNLIARMHGGGEYARTSDRFTMQRPDLSATRPSSPSR